MFCSPKTSQLKGRQHAVGLLLSRETHDTDSPFSPTASTRSQAMGRATGLSQLNLTIIRASRCDPSRKARGYRGSAARD